MPDRECARPSCRISFTPERTWQKYHSPECRKLDWEASNQRVSANSFEALIKIVQEAELDSPLFKEMQKAVYSRVQQSGKRKRKS